MRIATLTANLGKFDKNVDPVEQKVPEGVEVVFHRWTDENFPLIAGLTPRLQYRIPKLFGWEMFPGYDYYLWIDGSLSLQREDSLQWFMNQIGDNDMALFKHPWRSTIKEEVDYIEEKLQIGNKYITSRYSNGLHKQQLEECLSNPEFHDNSLYASTAFIYKNTQEVQEVLKKWWYQQSKHFSCDQMAMTYVVNNSDLKIKVMKENVFDFKYLKFTKH